MESYAASAIDLAGTKAKYDAQVKRILKDRHILGWIIKETVSEFRGCDLETAANAIEGDVSVDTISIIPGSKPQAITGSETQSKIPGEGETIYDIRFYVRTPDGEHVKILINVEAQKKFNPGYDLTARGIFYCARMLSEQLDTEFDVRHYDNIKKVYSIWLCMETPAEFANTISEYHIEKRDLYGQYLGEAHSDLLSVIMVRLAKDDLNGGSELHKMLSTIFTDTLSTEEKKERLGTEYGIPMTVEMEQEVDAMCNLSDAIEEKGVTKGKLQTLVSLVRDHILTNEQAAERAGISLEEFLAESATL